MTDATREQIDTAAMKAWQEDGRPGSLANWTLGDDDDEARYWRTIYIKGATEQHPVAFEAGRKAGIEEALIEIEHVAMATVDTLRDYSIIKAVKQKLEALKTEINK